MNELKTWRAAKSRFQNDPGMNSAISLQVAERKLKLAVKKKLKVIKGGKS